MKDTLLRKIIKESGMKQADIALKLGTSPSYISLWCKGFRIPFKYHERLAKILKTKIEDILTVLGYPK